MRVSQNSYSLEYILDNVSEFDILTYYLGIYKVPTFIKSPLRKDKHPSLGVYSVDGIKIRYKDFASGDWGDTFDLVAISLRINKRDLIKRISADLTHIKGVSGSNTLRITSKSPQLLGNNTSKDNKKVDVKVRAFAQHDIDYWGSYGIPISIVKWGNIYPISHIIVTMDDETLYIPADKYAYVYIENKDNIVSFKIYQPYSKKYKWYNNHDPSVWDLWEKIPQKGEHLVITSSRKDALCIIANTGIPALSLQAESYFPKEIVILLLKSRFTHVLILYDNDFTAKKNYGRILGDKIATKYNLTQIEIPEMYKSKDASDLYKMVGKRMFISIIKQLIIKN